MSGRSFPGIWVEAHAVGGEGRALGTTVRVLGREPYIWPTGGSIVSQPNNSFRPPEDKERLPASIGRGLLSGRLIPCFWRTALTLQKVFWGYSERTMISDQSLKTTHALDIDAHRTSF
jgi:hypothetical protein